jgi:hypothetical protein
LDAEFGVEHVAQPAEGGKRVGLAAAAVQRQHEVPVQVLAERVLLDQLFQFG